MPRVTIPSTGVYQIRCTVNGKVYVGSASESFRQRWKNHRNELNGQRHGNRHLLRAWNKHGESVFIFEVLEHCKPEDCVVREQHWLNAKDACNPEKGYNLCPTAGSRLGTKFTEETKRKQSLAKLGKKHTNETRARMSAGQRKRNASGLPTRSKAPKVHWSKKSNAKEVAAKIAAFNRGAKRSEETKARISAAKRGLLVDGVILTLATPLPPSPSKMFRYVQ